mmetsp:Transcript_22447/g.46780  ORF Transcript_22447/g.46780 Transcript_22447/m.46780 type:complete len:204 (-) Transcript_22447:466-1077(-)
MSCTFGLMRSPITCRPWDIRERAVTAIMVMNRQQLPTMTPFGPPPCMSWEKIFCDFTPSIGPPCSWRPICPYRNDCLPTDGGPRMDKKFPNLWAMSLILWIWWKSTVSIKRASSSWRTWDLVMTEIIPIEIWSFVSIPTWPMNWGTCVSVPYPWSLKIATRRFRKSWENSPTKIRPFWRRRGDCANKRHPTLPSKPFIAMSKS